MVFSDNSCKHSYAHYQVCLLSPCARTGSVCSNHETNGQHWWCYSHVLLAWFAQPEFFYFNCGGVGTHFFCPRLSFSHDAVSFILPLNLAWCCLASSQVWKAPFHMITQMPQKTSEVDGSSYFLGYKLLFPPWQVMWYHTASMETQRIGQLEATEF